MHHDGMLVKQEQGHLSLQQRQTHIFDLSIYPVRDPISWVRLPARSTQGQNGVLYAVYVHADAGLTYHHLSTQGS